MEEEKKKVMHTTWFGTFVVEEDEVVDKELFPKDAKKIADRKFAREKGEVLKEEKLLAQRWKDEIQVASKRLSDLGRELEESIVDVDIDPKDYSFDDSLLQKALLELGEKKVRESIDFGEYLAKAVDTIQDLNEIINMKKERLRDFYSLHFPELEKKVEEERFVDLIASHGEREQIIDEIDLDGKTTGGKITEKEKNLFKMMANHLKNDIEYRRVLHDYVEERMKEQAPNLTELAGAKLGGELIAKEGSLESLAKQPASTIQVLGAEKALFKHLDEDTKPPKHGLILQHPLVHDASKSLRGKIARAFANKIAIAARLDYFGGDKIGDELKDDLIERIKEIKKKEKDN